MEGEVSPCAPTSLVATLSAGETPATPPSSLLLYKDKPDCTNCSLYIKDNEGNLRCEEGEFLSDRELLGSMDWYVEGVVLYEEVEY